MATESEGTPNGADPEALRRSQELKDVMDGLNAQLGTLKDALQGHEQELAAKKTAFEQWKAQQEDSLNAVKSQQEQTIEKKFKDSSERWEKMSAQSSADAVRAAQLAKDTTEIAQNQVKWIGPVATAIGLSVPIFGLIFALVNLWLKGEVDQLGIKTAETSSLQASMKETQEEFKKVVERQKVEAEKQRAEGERQREFSPVFRKAIVSHMIADCRDFLEEYSISQPSESEFRRIRLNQESIALFSSKFGDSQSAAAPTDERSVLEWVGRVNEAILKLSSRRATPQHIAQAEVRWRELDDELEKVPTDTIKDPDYHRFLQTELRSYVKNTRAILQIALAHQQNEPAKQIEHYDQAEKYANDALSANESFSRAYSNLAIVRGYKLEMRADAAARNPLADLAKLIDDNDVAELIIGDQLRQASLLAGTPRTKSIALNNTADMYLFKARLLGDYLARAAENPQLDQKKRAEKIKKAKDAIDHANDYIADAKRLVNAAPVVYFTDVQARCLEWRLRRVAEPSGWKPDGIEQSFSEIEKLLDLATRFEFSIYESFKNLDSFLQTPPFDVLRTLAENSDDLKHTYRLRLSRALHLPDQ